MFSPSARPSPYNPNTAQPCILAPFMPKAQTLNPELKAASPQVLVHKLRPLAPDRVSVNLSNPSDCRSRSNFQNYSSGFLPKSVVEYTPSPILISFVPYSTPQTEPCALKRGVALRQQAATFRPEPKPPKPKPWNP